MGQLTEYAPAPVVLKTEDKEKHKVCEILLKHKLRSFTDILYNTIIGLMLVFSQTKE